MLRLATDTAYEVEITVAGTPTKFTLKAASVHQRAQVLDAISDCPPGAAGVVALCDTLCTIIGGLPDYPDKDAKDVLLGMEHRADLDELAMGIIRWCTLEEQSVKNFASSSERSQQDSAGSAEKPAEPVAVPASTTPARADAS